jgi:hypothetical protein
MSRHRHARHSELGFSLAEVFVATAIFAVIFIAALLVYDRSNKIFKSGVEASDLQQNTRVAFDKMLSDVRLSGFDYDRDGVPTALGESQQPDEQIEYAGTSALTIRGNLNYNDATTDGGRVKALELPNSQFPIVTTSNDEIVTYALVPDSPSAVTESMTFYADVTDGSAPKRQSYPGGSVEDTITISGIDLCDDDKNGDGKIGCEQPPYTLYRFTVNDAGGVERTPLANNIRDLQFQYFNDITGTTKLAVTDPGGGKYDPATPATLNAAARVKRAEIKAVRVSVVGMNNSPDPAWSQPGELIASVKNRRQYTLESMVVPRNLGKRGMREQQTAPPGVPTLVSVCFNYCGLVQVNWQAPASNSTYGEVETYHVLWDTDTTKTMASPPASTQPAGLATSSMLGGLTPDVEYRFSVAATNSYGTSYASTLVKGVPLNGTTPQPPTLDSVTGTTAATVQKNAVQLAWTLPSANITGANTASCKTPAGATSSTAATPQAGEMQGIEIWRSTDAIFDPNAAPSAKVVKVATASASAGTFIDTTAANCLNYYYRIRVVEYCFGDTDQNLPGVVAASGFDPPIGSPGIKGRSESTETPAKPGPLTVNLAGSSCSGANCTVSVSWPQVTTDLAGSTIGIDAYEIGVVSVPVISPAVSATVSVSAGTATVSGGVVTAVITVPKSSPSPGSIDYLHNISARATQCGKAGDWSNSDYYPKCNFAGGEAVTVSMTGVNAGLGTAASPYEILGAEVVTFALPAGSTKKLTRVEAAIYNASTNALVKTYTPVTGSGTSLTLAWPDSADNTNFRLDYTLYDGSTPIACSRNGSIYVRETVVSCPFQIISAPGEKLTSVPAITFPLSNLTPFDITFVKAEIVWDKSLAVSNVSKDTAQITRVELPPLSGTTPIPATLTGSVSASGTVTAATSGAAKVFANDATGKYVLTVLFAVAAGPGGKNNDLDSQPIKSVRIFYKLQGDTAADALRECDVFTK